ncbi:MAG TPA: class I SAM-dependent methyltransferase [Jatrophihabitantaceae bacterium]
MPIEHSGHENRVRAESFGSVAEEYDRYRPSYPDALISDLLGLAPARTLDVACGTGKVAVPLLACGLAVLGVEVDSKMAEIARRHGIFVELGAFETWDDEGRRFDLVTCGQAWHWIDPDEGARKAATVLVPGGTLAVFWNYGVVQGELRADLERVYRELAPDVGVDAAGHRHEDEGYAVGMKSSGLFASVREQTYQWSATLDTDEWIARLSTHSDHITLPPDRRAALLDAVRAVIDKHESIVEVRSGTYTIFARTPER